MTMNTFCQPAPSHSRRRSRPASEQKKYAVGYFITAALAASLCLLMGCAAIAPGADPVVVRAEQVQTVAKGTFDLIVRLDHRDRGFWRTNAPAFHSFVDQVLREPVPVGLLPEAPTGLATLPRFIAVQWQLDRAKLQYKAVKSEGSSNALAAALTAVQALSQQAQAWLTIVTNNPAPPN